MESEVNGMKKNLIRVSVVIGVLIAFILTGVCAFANTLQGTVYKTLEDGSACYLQSFDELASGKIEIPKVYNGLAVTGIEADAFLKCKNISAVIVPKTVTYIGEFALGYTLNENGEKIKQGICNRIEKKKKILSSTPADHQLLGQVSPEVSKEIKSLVCGIGRVLDEK
jgi:hypothetical protein